MARETSISDMFSLSGPRIAALGLVLGFVSLGGASSCLYHASDRCDSDQTYNDAAGLCVCDESLNLIAGDHGCVPCDANATAKDDACTCNDGYSGDGMTCTAVPKALGLACTSDADCTDATYNTCHIVTDGSSYCTNTACTTVDDATCTGGYACDLSATPSYCERPPSGAGMACKSNDDCAGTDATYCESFNTHQCFVQNCSLTKNDCFPGKECCDLGPLSGGIVKAVICVDSGSCGN